MKLISAQVKEFKSIWDSNQFDIGDVTCLVGKNEAGKTALLQAIYKLNPYINVESEFDVTNDYPRAEVSDYEEEVDDGLRSPVKVVEGTFDIQTEDLGDITNLFGENALNTKILKLNAYPFNSG